jgi:hypothetical protein
MLIGQDQQRPVAVGGKFGTHVSTVKKSRPAFQFPNVAT